MTLVRISSIADEVEPVDLEEMKEHLRVDYSDEDDLIEQYISAARRKLEQRCARAFVEQTWELQVPAFEDAIELPKPPTMEIVQVSFIDTSGAEQVVSEADYAMVAGGEYRYSSLIWSSSKPTGLARRPDAARVRFKAGWAVEDFPADLKMAIMLVAASMYELRQDTLLTPVRQEIQPLPDGAATYYAPYVMMRL